MDQIVDFVTPILMFIILSGLGVWLWAKAVRAIKELMGDW